MEVLSFRPLKWDVLLIRSCNIWIGLMSEQRVYLAPYFVYYGKNKDQKNDGDNAASKIEKVTADFMEYELPNDNTKFDLLLCSQVLEHVPNPKPFLKKLLSTAKTCIISIPFNWKPCG